LASTAWRTPSGFATGPVGLFVFGLVALAAIAYKVKEAHDKQSEALKDLIEKQDGALKKTVELKDKLEEYEKVVGRLPARLGLAETRGRRPGEAAGRSDGAVRGASSSQPARRRSGPRSGSATNLIELRREEVGYPGLDGEGQLRLQPLGQRGQRSHVQDQRAGRRDQVPTRTRSRS
jgi:hypothetical protein